MKTFSLFIFLSIQSVLLHAFAPTANHRQMKQSVSFSRMAASAPSSTSQLMMSAQEGGVVITGSAGGVGFAYAGEFMDRGFDVVICDVKDCSEAAKSLAARHPNGTVYATQCDVSDSKSVAALGEFAKKNMGTIKYWINNAGVNGGRRALRDVPVSQVELVVKVNLLGILLCTKTAMDIMADQAGVTGHIFNTGMDHSTKQTACLDGYSFIDVH